MFQRFGPALLLVCACASPAARVATDAGFDASSPDASVANDAGPSDAGSSDAGVDAGSVSDAGLDAGSVADAGVDAGPADPVIHVSPSGSGADCSSSSPCALETGRGHARAAITAATDDVVVSLAGGAYRLGHTFALDANDSGAGGHAIIYRAAAGESPVLSGALAVTGFAPSNGTAVWVADVPVGTQSRQLFVNGRRATRARGALNPAGYTHTSTGFALGDASIATWPDRAGLELVGTQQWRMFRCPVTSVETTGLVAANPCWTSSQGTWGFDTLGWLENARELVDSGGEFFLDGAAGKLYYQPRDGEDLASADVELPVVEKLVEAVGTHDVAFEGIGFEYATWLAPSSAEGYSPVQSTVTNRNGGQEKALANVTLHGTQHVRFSACRFAHLGGAALAIEPGAKSNLVESSRFEDISAGAVMIGDVTHYEDHHPPDDSYVVADNTVRDSFITRVGAEYYDACGLFVGYTTRTTLTQNELFDLPYTGISVGWGWGSVDVGGAAGLTTPTPSLGNTISNNSISYYLRALRDGGAIYTLGSQAGSTISGNFVSNQAAPYGNLYLDNGTQHYTVSNNLVLMMPKIDTAGDERSYWLYVQVYDVMATNNVIGANFTNDPTLFTPQPINASNGVTMPSTNVAAGASIRAGAGSSLRSPEVAEGKPVTASSTFDVGHSAASANNGNGFDGWSPAGADAHPWWQVDLGANYAVDNVEVVSRWGIDQASTRRSFRVVGSVDAAFTAPIVLGSVDATGIPHRAIFSADVTPPATVRYVRVEKTVSEYFFLGEVRVHGR